MDAVDWLSDGWVLTVMGLILLLSFIWLNWKSYGSTSDHKDVTICHSPDCARCLGLDTSPDLTFRLKNRCEEFFQKSPNAETKCQILSLITDSTSQKNDIIHSIYEESNYKLQQDKTENIPRVWMLPGLERHTFWTSKLRGGLQEVVKVLERPDNVESILAEYEHISQQEKGWKFNSIPLGKWKVYHLYNQGARIEENSAQCPFTTKLLTSLSAFMCPHVYGNAMFSVLEPGSSIEPHIGPCNYRLRCHLPLEVPPGYRIRVGPDTFTWVEGQLMIFDDSFVHEVWHKERAGNIYGRAVLIFDIWHPSVTSNQQAAIQYIFE